MFILPKVLSCLIPIYTVTPIPTWRIANTSSLVAVAQCIQEMYYTNPISKRLVYCDNYKKS